jgi:hypothetical protein
MDAAQQRSLDAWIGGLDLDSKVTIFLLLDELCEGMDVSRHSDFGFLRLRAEFETSGEIFGCSLEELRDAVGASLGEAGARLERPRSALRELRRAFVEGGHPDFR